jgi:hypothetical protein
MPSIFPPAVGWGLNGWASALPPPNGVQYANRSAVWMSVDIWIVGPALERALVGTALRILTRT